MIAVYCCYFGHAQSDRTARVLLAHGNGAQRYRHECLSHQHLKRDHLAQVHSGVTFVQTEPDEDWRPPAAVCISTEHEWRLAGCAFKEQVGTSCLSVAEHSICGHGLG